MAESIVQVTEGSGKKLHTWSRTIGANTVEDEAMFLADTPYATYVTALGSSVSTATAASHLLQIMAGASLNVYVRHIRIIQSVVATTAAFGVIQLLRLSTAGTGGTAVTPQQHDTADAASGATTMTLPTVKGTEGAALGSAVGMFIQTVPTGGPGTAALLAEWDFDTDPRLKPLRIAAGTANGIAIKQITAIAGASVLIEIRFSEANF